MDKSIIIPRDILEKIQEAMINTTSERWVYKYNLDASTRSCGAADFSKMIYQDDAMDTNSLVEDDYRCIKSLQYLLSYLIETEECFKDDEILLRVMLNRTYSYPAEIDEPYHVDIPKEVYPAIKTKTVILYLNDVDDAKCGTKYVIDDTIHKVYHNEGTCVILDGDIPYKRFFDGKVKERIVLNINIGN